MTPKELMTPMVVHISIEDVMHDPQHLKPVSNNIFQAGIHTYTAACLKKHCC